MRTLVIALGLLGLLYVMTALTSGQPPAGQPASEQARLRAELRRLEQLYGSNHPDVLTVKARLAEADPVSLKGTVLVHTRPGAIAAATSLRDIRVVPLGGRPFLVGTEVRTDYSKGMFPGKQVWIPMEEVTQMVELGDGGGEKK